MRLTEPELEVEELDAELVLSNALMALMCSASFFFKDCCLPSSSSRNHVCWIVSDFLIAPMR